MLLSESMKDLDQNNIFSENKATDFVRDNIRNADLAMKAKTDVNIADLKKQWEEAASEFTKRRWIYRLLTDKDKERMQKHVDAVCSEDINYSTYKRSFDAICKFMGIPSDIVIIEWVQIQKDKEQNQYKLAVRFTKGRVKVRIPEGVRLIHVSPVEGITNLEPSFRSKSAGKFLYPTKRAYFTVVKEINAFKFGVAKGSKTYRYTPKNHIEYAYIDSSYSKFAYGSVFVETDSPIPVENMKRKLTDYIDSI